MLSGPKVSQLLGETAGICTRLCPSGAPTCHCCIPQSFTCGLREKSYDTRQLACGLVLRRGHSRCKLTFNTSGRARTRLTAVVTLMIGTFRRRYLQEQLSRDPISVHKKEIFYKEWNKSPSNSVPGGRWISQQVLESQPCHWGHVPEPSPSESLGAFPSLCYALPHSPIDSRKRAPSGYHIRSAREVPCPGGRGRNQSQKLSGREGMSSGEDHALDFVDLQSYLQNLFIGLLRVMASMVVWPWLGKDWYVRLWELPWSWASIRPGAMEGCRHPCHGYLAQRLCAADTCKWKCLSLSWFVLGCWRFHGRCHPSGYAAFPGYPAWPGSLNLKHQGASHLVLRSVSWCLSCPTSREVTLLDKSSP